MNTMEIIEFIEPFKKKTFKGVFASDDLPFNVKLPACFVINLSRKTESGSHWVALFINIYGHAYYFDSFGIPPRNKEIIFFIRSHAKKFDFNKKQIQHISSSKCGKFCCAFIVATLLNKKIKNFMNTFSSNLYVNEIVIEKLYEYLKLCNK